MNEKNNNKQETPKFDFFFLHFESIVDTDEKNRQGWQHVEAEVSCYASLFDRLLSARRKHGLLRKIFYNLILQI